MSKRSKLALTSVISLGFALAGFIALFERVSPIFPCDVRQVCSPSLQATYVDPQIQSYAFPAIGSGQGVQRVGGHIYIYGQDDGGVVQELDLDFRPTGWIGRLTKNGAHLIPHPTGLAYREGYPTIIGGDDNFFVIDWPLFKADKNLDRAHLHTLEGEHRPLSAAEQKDGKNSDSARPEYVELQGRWVVATAGEYFRPNNHVILMDPFRMSTARTIKDEGVILHKITAAPCVQTLHWHSDRHELVLVQNQFRARGWQLSFIDLERAVAAGSTADAVTGSVAVAQQSELEGYVALPDGREVFVAAETDHNVLVGRIATGPTSQPLVRRLSFGVLGLYGRFLRYCFI